MQRSYVSKDQRWMVSPMPPHMRIREALAVRVPIIGYNHASGMYKVDVTGGKREVLHATKGWRKVR